MDEMSVNYYIWRIKLSDCNSEMKGVYLYIGDLPVILFLDGIKK